MKFLQFLRKRRSCASDGEPLCFPLAITVRIALLDTRLRTDSNIRLFESQHLGGLQEYAPEAIVAPLDLALSLADQKTRGLFDLPSLNVAIVVITSVDDSPLAEHHRDLLWRAFGVPVFEQLRGSDGAIIARECEVHDGLHISAELAREFGEAITYDQCECGSEVPRLLQSRRTIAAQSGS